MIRRGESGWVDVRRAFMVARWWCDRVPPQVSTGNRTLVAREKKTKEAKSNEMTLSRALRQLGTACNVLILQ